MALAAQGMAVPAAAQDADQSLEDLIPDEAVADPEGWAAQGVPADIAAQVDSVPEIDADTPLSDMPLVTVPWPEDIDLADVQPLEPDAEPVEFVQFEDVIPPLPEGSEEKISDELVLVFPSENSLFPERDEFIDRFKSLSTITTLSDDDNLARLEAQARADEDLLKKMLRVYGYFDAQVIRSVGEVSDPAGSELDRPAARFDIIPGTRFAIGAVDLGPLDGEGQPYEDYAALRAAFEIASGDPVSMDDIEIEQADLDTKLGETGYPFAKIEAPELLVDHDRTEADLTMITTPGGQYVIGDITSSLPDFMSGNHLEDIARFDTGDLYQRSLEMDLRRAILATGIVGSVQMTPTEVQAPTAQAPGVVDITVDMTEAPLRTLAGSIGFGTEEGIRLAGSWEHRNLFPPEGSLKVRGIVGTQEQLAGVTFRKNNFKARDRVLTVDAYASALDYPLYEANTASLIATYEKLSNLLYQKRLSFGTGLELVATQEQEVLEDGTTGDRQTFFIAALPSYVQFDTSDSLLDPREGFRARLALSPEISRLDSSNSTYVKAQFDLAKYQSVSDKIVVAGRVRVGSIYGADLDQVAPSRRFYAGGGGSVRGYGYRAIGPRDGNNVANGGASLLEASIEARIDTPLLDGALGVVPFLDAGTVGTGSTPTLNDIRFGAGIGARYYTGFGPLRLDVAVPLNRGPDDSWIAVYVALGQAF